LHYSQAAFRVDSHSFVHLSPLKILGPSCESRPQPINFDIHVPSDERFGPNKLKELKSNCVHAMVHFLSPKAELLPRRNSANFQSFEELLDMFSSNRNQKIEGWMRDNLKKLIPVEHLKEINHAMKENRGQLAIPQIISGKKNLDSTCLYINISVSWLQC